MLVLYVVSIGVAWMFGKKQARGREPRVRTDATRADSGRGGRRRWLSALAGVAGRRRASVATQDRAERRATACITAALAAIEKRLRRADRRARSSSTARSTACCARSIRTRASSTPQRLRADARAAGGPLLRASASPSCSVDGDITVTHALRGVAGLSRRHPARRRHRARQSADAKTRPRAGRREDVVKRVRGPEGHDGRHLDPPARRRHADRPDRRARRDQHHHASARRS